MNLVLYSFIGKYWDKQKKSVFFSFKLTYIFYASLSSSLESTADAEGYDPYKQEVEMALARKKADAAKKKEEEESRSKVLNTTTDAWGIADHLFTNPSAHRNPPLSQSQTLYFVSCHQPSSMPTSANR